MVSLLDIIGPVMVGPSSSHTAGAARIGLLARGLVGGTPERAVIELHGSFARTGEGHGTGSRKPPSTTTHIPTPRASPWSVGIAGA
jgi:iron-sulfur-dependent L-serine dehydratase beta subunit